MLGTLPAPSPTPSDTALLRRKTLLGDEEGGMPTVRPTPVSGGLLAADRLSSELETLPALLSSSWS